MLKDYEIAHQKKLIPIKDIAKKANIPEENLIYYGNYKAKVTDFDNGFQGELILVTAINPTPFGEGKTTVAIGLHDAFRKLGISSMLTLREPSMGPVFGIKGGATGGGYAQVLPMEDINLHFNGDFHAITSANNLISAMIDNSLKQGNPLNIDCNEIYFERTLDMNDRSLREIEIGLGGKINGVPRHEHFTITAASEMMAVFGMSTDLKDLRRRVNQIIIAKDLKGEYLTVKDLGITGSVLALLKDAMEPNLVQTLEENPVLIHGGPFANIAPGVNTIRAINLARKISPLVITEAGFGSDLGGFKFLDIICRKNNFKPSVVVLVATVKALKYNGGVSKENILLESLSSLEKGICNLEAHMNNLDTMKVPYVVTLNQYETDTAKEIQFVEEFVTKRGKKFVCNNVHALGGEGAMELANVLNQFHEPSLELIYKDDDKLESKIKKVCQKIFHAKDVLYTEEAQKKLVDYEKDFGTYPLCIAKTQYSLSDEEEKLGYPKDFTVTVRDLHVSNGAEFIVVYLGNITTMPGLSKEPAALQIDINDKNEIIGIF